jgi:hypothetical protein
MHHVAALQKLLISFSLAGNRNVRVECVLPFQKRVLVEMVLRLSLVCIVICDVKVFFLPAIIKKSGRYSTYCTPYLRPSKKPLSLTKRMVTPSGLTSLPRR